MAGNTTTNGGAFTNDGTIANNSPVVRAAVYSAMMQEEILDGFLPEGLARDVSEFGDGSQIIIPQLGNVSTIDFTEDTTKGAGQVVDISKNTLTIQKYRGAKTYITDELKEDSYQAMAIEAAMPRKHLRALREDYETDMLSQQSKQISATASFQAGAYGEGLTNDERCVINGVPHRWAAGGTNTTLALADFAAAKLALDKANVPAEGRIAIVDPVAEATLNNLIGAQGFAPVAQWSALLETGFAQNNRFLANIYGFDVYISNYNATLGAADTDLRTFDEAYAGVVGTPVEVTGLKTALFMCVADDEVTPIMSAWRRMPKMEGDREVDLFRDVFYSSARWGFGIQRPESLVVIAHSATAFK
jgi:hypothetical protein